MTLKVAVFGTGAIGGHVAARLLALGQHQVSVVARGAHLAAIRQQGLRLRSGERELHGRPAAATDDARTLGAQDLVLVALKSNALARNADAIAGLLGPAACAVFLVNGIPWWWRHGAPQTTPPGPLPLLDPEGALWREVGPERVLGCALYSANEVAEPGLVVHSGFNRWILGEPDGTDSNRLRRVSALFTQAGMAAERTCEIRRAIWKKLLANASGNTLGALTRLTAAALNEDPDLRELRERIVEELLATGAALGIDLREEVARQPVAAPDPALRNVRASMLQDVLLGRPLEVEAVVGQPHAFARACGISTPALDVVAPLLRGLDRSLRLAQH